MSKIPIEPKTVAASIAVKLKDSLTKDELATLAIDIHKAMKWAVKKDRVIRKETRQQMEEIDKQIIDLVEKKQIVEGVLSGSIVSIHPHASTDIRGYKKWRRTLVKEKDTIELELQELKAKRKILHVPIED